MMDKLKHLRILISTKLILPFTWLMQQTFSGSVVTGNLVKCEPVCSNERNYLLTFISMGVCVMLLQQLRSL